MYAFLDNFHQRMEQIAIHHFVNELVSIKDILRVANLNKEQVLNLVMQLLCYIMEKSLLEQACTLQDMTFYLGTLLTEQDIQVDHSLGEELTRYLVRDALQNGGKPYYFESYNFSKQQKTQIHVRLIEDRLTLLKGKEVFSYGLTAQGYEFLFGTLEVEEALQMSFEQLKLKYAIQKRNFGSAKESVDNLFTLNKKQIKRIKEYIQQIKEDVGQFSTANYEDTYRTTFETLDEQKEKHEELYQLIVRTQEQYFEQQMNHEDPKLEEDLSYIDYIKTRLQQLLSEQLKLFKEQQTLGEVYDEAISNVLYIGFENRLDIEKDLMVPFEKNPSSIEGMAKILRPLFMPDLDRRFNFNKAYSPQKIESFAEVEEADDHLLEEIIDEEAERLYEAHLEYVQETYEKIVSTILMGIVESEDKQVKLSMLFSESDDVSLLRNVLIQLHNDVCLNVGEVLKSTKEHVYSPTVDFDLGYTLSRMREKTSLLNHVTSIRATILKDEIVTILSEKTKTFLRCNNILFEDRGQ